jgi:hypothetical protein
MSRLSMWQRRRLPARDFAIPEKRPGPGSYPINDENHARNALARVEENGTPAEQRRVKAAVHRRYPGIEQDG